MVERLESIIESQGGKLEKKVKMVEAVAILTHFLC